MRTRRLSGLLLKAVGLGALLMVALFALECAGVLTQNAIGLNVDTSGPFEAFLAVIKPRVPGLLLRVAGAYAVAGGLLGVASTVLASAWTRRWRGASWVIALVEFALLVLLLAWDRAIWRPALFDDLPFVKPLLGFLVAHGEPWHPKLFAAFFGLLHLGVGYLRRGPAALRPMAMGAAAAAAVLLAWASWRGISRSTRAPLVVLIGIDAFRPDRVEHPPGAVSVAPHLEAFLADATRFTRAYTPIAQTEPAWRSILTASWPFRTGVRYPLTRDADRAPLPTFAEVFARAGYGTTFATDCSRFNYQDGTSGFATRLEPPRGALNFLLEKLRFRALGLFADNALGAVWLPEFINNRALAGIYDPYGYAHRLADILTRAGQGPLLFAFHDTAAHFPGDPVYPYYRRFVSPAEPLERRLRMFFSPLGTASEANWNLAGSEGLYDELLAQADGQLGILLASLKSSGRYDDALVVVFSDHGESFHADFPNLSGATPVHGARLSDEENRTLLAVKLPGQRAREGRPAVVNSLVRLIDLGPTLLEAMGLPPLEHADGVSLLPLLKGESMAPLKLYAETGYTHAAPDVFDPEHFSGGARGFDAYQVRPNGAVEMTPRARAVALAEKDTGAFDGAGWLTLAPRRNGSMLERCQGECSPALRQWFNEVTGKAEKGTGSFLGGVDGVTGTKK